MENAGILQLLAELAIGVLGFSGVVAVLGRRSEGEWAAVDRYRFLSMVHLTVIVLVLAILPFPLHSAGFASDTIWGWCSGVGAILMVFMRVASRIVEPVPKGMYSDSGTSRLALAYAFPALYGAWFLFAMNATGVGLERTFTPYLVAVLLTFGFPLILFIRLLHTAVGPGPAA